MKSSWHKVAFLGMLALNCAATPTSKAAPATKAVAIPASPSTSLQVAPSATGATSSVSLATELSNVEPTHDVSEDESATDPQGVKREIAPDHALPKGFGPPEGSTEHYGMVNLLAQPPNTAPKRPGGPKRSSK